VPLSSKQLAFLRSSPLPATGNKLAVALALTDAKNNDICVATGLGAQYVSDVKCGRFSASGLKLANASKFAQFFGCAIEDLFPPAEGSEPAQADPSIDSRSVRFRVDGRAACDDAHTWAPDFAYGDTCRCGTYYLLCDAAGDVRLEPRRA
jgi:hypothetical protein